MTWLEYLKYEREQKRSQIEMLESGRVRSYMTTNGVQRETTLENAERLKTEIAEIEQILTDEGIVFDA